MRRHLKTTPNSIVSSMGGRFFHRLMLGSERLVRADHEALSQKVAFRSAKAMSFGTFAEQQSTMNPLESEHEVLVLSWFSGKWNLRSSGLNRAATSYRGIRASCPKGFSHCGNIEGKRAASCDAATLRRFTWHGARTWSSPEPYPPTKPIRFAR